MASLRRHLKCAVGQSYWVILVLISVLHVQFVSSLPDVIRIGGLFVNEDNDHDVENAFKFAVDRINADKTLLRNTRLEYIVEHIATADSYLVSQAACKQVTLGMSALFGPQPSHLAAHINSLCNSLDIPHLEARPETNVDAPPLSSINLYPDRDILTQVYLDCVKRFNWKKILVLYTGDDSLLNLQTFVRTPFSNDVELTVRQVNAQDMHAVLRDADKYSWRHIIADMSVADTRLLLRTALQEGMINSNHHYILTNLDVESISMEDFRHNYVNLTTFRLVPRDDRRVRSVLSEMKTFLDRRQSRRTEFIKTEAALMFDAVYTLAYGLRDVDRSQQIQPSNLSCYEEEQWPYGSSLYNAMNTVDFDGVTGKIANFQDGRRRDVTIEILFMTGDGLKKVGHWAPLTGINFTEPFEVPTKGVKFGFNTTLNVTSILDPPFVMLRDGYEHEDGNGRYMGFCIELLENIATIVGFEYKITLVPDGKYGVRDEHGVWNGMVNELIQRRADLAVASLTINYLREQAIDFTKPFMNLGISILFRVPESQTPGLFSFLNPLALEIWLYVLVAYVAVSFLMFIMGRFSPYEWHNPHPCEKESEVVHNVFNISNSFWFTVGTLMQQGSDINPRALSTRIIGGVWWFFTLIIISSYTANLAAFLTVERMDSPIDNADDLAKQTDIAYGTISGGSTMTFFQESQIPNYQKMWKFMKSATPSVFVKDTVEGIERVNNGKYAFLMESVMIDYNVQRNCTLMQVGGLLDSKGYGIGTPTGSPYRDRISLAILELQENGKIQMMYDRWWKNAGTCSRDDKKESKANPLGVANVGGIFVVLLVGLALAFIAAIVEFSVSNKRHSRPGQKVKQSLCVEILEEFRFALSCTSKKRVVLERNYSKRSHNGQSIDSPNGVIQLRELRRSPMTGMREYRSPSPLPDLYCRDFGGRPSSPLRTFDDRGASIYGDLYN